MYAQSDKLIISRLSLDKVDSQVKSEQKKTENGLDSGIVSNQHK